MTEHPIMHIRSETLVLAEHLGDCAATQPCSGVTTVVPRAFSPGSGTASPAVKSVIKSVA